MEDPVSLHRRLATGAVLCAAALLATACSSGSGGTVQGAKLISKGALTTCTHLPYPPFQSEVNGKVVGFDVSMLDLVATKLGVKQKIVDTPFETVKTGSALNAGKCDVAAGGITIKPERAKFIDFSESYFDATQALMGKKGLGTLTLDQVKAKKLKVGSQASTTGEDYVHSHGIDSVSFKDSASLHDGLRSGRVDVIIEDYPVVQGWLKDPADSADAIVANLHTGEKYGFAVRKGYNPKLLALINEAITTAKQDGTYKQIYEKWIGPLPTSSS